MFRSLYARCTLGVTLMFCTLPAAMAQTAAPDSTLYTSYTVSTSLQSVDWIVCGSTAESDGCYGSGTLGTFGHVGAMLEGQPVVSGNTVTREIYILDTASGSAATGVTLSVFTKTDIVSSSDDQITVTPLQTVSLPLVGGSSVTASMAANSVSLYIGTNQSTQAVSVVKDAWTVRTIGGFSPPITVAAITADPYGFVTVTYGVPGGSSSAFVVFSPTGAGEEDGGGPNLILNTLNAVIPAPLPF